MAKEKDELKMVVLAVSPRLARLVKKAVSIESEGPRRDDHSEEEIEMLEGVIGEIDSQLTVKA